ncbi:MAG: N-acetyltransferase [Deltaproteobacteria bacterium]|nr:MAG: N-acetyltransferase [Deltaproteobacteria bacterium]
MIDRTLAACLPGLHEAQERLETGNILAAGLGDELGIATRDHGDGLWQVRCASAPNHHAGNQVMGMRAEHLARLPAFTAFADEAACALYLRWPGPTADDDVAKPLAEHGFGLHVLEAWMAAPIASLAVDAAAHDIREVDSEAATRDFATAFTGGWQIKAELQRVALAAMAPWPGPAAWRRYVAYVDGEPAGEALLTQIGEVAYLAEAATVPGFRKRGIQRALIARRIADARASGATTVFGAVQYGDQSWANMRALGLREEFLTVGFKREARTSPR